LLEHHAASGHYVQSYSSSYWIDNLGFITDGKLAAIFIKTSLGVFQLAGHLLHIPTSTWHRSFCRRCRVLKKKLSYHHHRAINKFSGAVAGEEIRLLQGEFHMHILYFVLSFALLYFDLHHFIKNTKKLVSFIVVALLLLVHYVVP
jgi:hypothetical protein